MLMHRLQPVHFVQLSAMLQSSSPSPAALTMLRFMLELPASPDNTAKVVGKHSCCCGSPAVDDAGCANLTTIFH